MVAVCAAIAILTAIAQDPGITAAAGELTITSSTPPYAVYDHNKPAIQSPGVFAAQADVCNSGGTALTDVTVMIGDGTTPGTFPETMFGGDNYQLLMLDEVVNSDVSDATRVLGNLADGECTTVYWQVVYPVTGNLTGLNLGWTVWGTAQDQLDPEMPEERTGSVADTVEIRSQISANANTMNPGTRTLTPSGPYAIGQTSELCFTNIDFGLVGSGENGVNDFSMQPIGNLDFNPDLWQMVEATSSLVSNKASCSGGTYDYTNELYYSTINDGDWTPPEGQEACNGNSQQVTGAYCYTFVAIGNGSTVVRPYQQASSGTQQKFNGDYGAAGTDLTVVVNQGCSVNLAKTADKSNVLSGDTLTYTVNYTNLFAQEIGTPPAALTITDAIPPNTTYQTGTATCPTGVLCTVYFSSDGTTFSTIQPGTVTHLRFIMNESIAASGTGSARYSVTVNTNTGVTAGSATSKFAGGVTCSSTNSVSHTPVTLAYFKADRKGDGVRFQWTTATEVGNVGFNLYEVTDAGNRLINAQLIPSDQVDSMSPTSYSYFAKGVKGSRFVIEDVDLNAVARTHGMFEAGVAFGSAEDGDLIDWNAIHAENDRLSAQRDASAIVDTQQRLSEIVAGGDYNFDTRTDALDIANNAIDQAPGRSKPIGSTSLSNTPIARLSVDTDGMVLVSYEQLMAAGISLGSIASSDLALVRHGKPVPVRVVSSSSTFGPGSTIEFYGEAAEGLYTRTNVYDLMVNPALRQSIGEFKTSKALPGAPVASYIETLTMDNNRLYGPESPRDDPWYDMRMLVFTSPGTWSVPVSVDSVAPGAATLAIKTFGGIDWPQTPDHHLQAAFNGAPIVDARFDGIQAFDSEVTLASGVLHNGANTLDLTLPGDSGFAYDLINYDGLELRYPRAFVARDGRLAFSAAGRVFKVSQLRSANVTVTRFVDDALPVRYDKVAVALQPDGTYSATFEGTTGMARYEVLSAPAAGPAAIDPVRTPADITATSTDYLVIAHPNFIPGIRPLVEHHTLRGLRVKVVDVRDVYDRYSFGNFDPLAIKAYIADAKTSGVRFVLLVGGDTYDYFNYANPGAMSFIPSLYDSTGTIVSFAPVDPQYADVDDDGVPDLAIGRFPVRTTSELDTLVAKTLTYASKSYGKTAVFAADKLDPKVNFTGDSEAFIAELPGGWSVERAHIDQVGLPNARATLLAKLNEGVALTSFVGHSSSTAWTFSGLFRSSDAAVLTNAGKPTAVVQWGCWNTYFVSASYNSLGHAFLLRGDRGAAAVLGASTLTEAGSEQLLGALVMPRLTAPGATIGEAVLDAKRELATTHANLVDVLLGWTVLGDPALQVEP